MILVRMNHPYLWVGHHSGQGCPCSTGTWSMIGTSPPSPIGCFNHFCLQLLECCCSSLVASLLQLHKMRHRQSRWCQTQRWYRTQKVTPAHIDEPELGAAIEPKPQRSLTGKFPQTQSRCLAWKVLWGKTGPLQADVLLLQLKSET
jgi:hypothetical protein